MRFELLGVLLLKDVYGTGIDASGKETDPRSGSDSIPGPDISVWADKAHEIMPLEYFENVLPSNSHRMGLVELGWALGDSRTSRVYRIADFGDKWVVKYNMYCPSENDTFSDPITRETFFLEIVNAHEPSVSFKHLFSSGSIPMPDMAGKFRKQRVECAGLVRVKYMVTERVGMTVYEILDGQPHRRMPIHVAAAMTIQVIRLLNKLHALDIVHGDMHVSNIVVTREEPVRLILIDFGLSKFGPSQAESDANVPGNNMFCHGFISFWESRYELISFRDDVFRAIQLFAILVHGMKYSGDIKDICNEFADDEDYWNYYALKKQQNLFDITLKLPQADKSKVKVRYPLRKIIGVRSRNEPIVRAGLLKLLEAIRAPATPIDKPNYEHIENILCRLIEVTHGPVALGEDPAAINFKPSKSN